MGLRKLAAMISTVNDYAILKWPIIIICFSITLLSFILLLSFTSDKWYSYDLIDVRHTIVHPNKTTQFTDLLEYGSFGLWFICIHKYKDQIIKCDTWTQETRPQYFNVILILLTCTLYLAYLAIFPCWVLLILILYNTNNRYMIYINAFIWIALLFFLFITVILAAILIINSLTKMHSPGRFFIDRFYISFHSSGGIHYLILATTLASICFLLSVVTLIWKTFIEMKIIELEGELLKQLSDENFQPIWNRPIPIPSTTTEFGANHEEPPPYNLYYEPNN
ncbi:unnamed protein product [Rotaria sp. Silwood1]|nr:unnamed protein product [Rotaria sp. Silwood1]